MSESLCNLFTHPWCILASGRLLCKERKDIISFPCRQQFNALRAQSQICSSHFVRNSGQYRGNNAGPSEQISTNCLQFGGVRQCWSFPLSELHPMQVSHKSSLPPCQGPTRLQSCNIPLPTFFSCSSPSKSCLKAQQRILKRLVLM